MAAIPTVLYFGDQQISGGIAGGLRAILGTTGDGLGTLVPGADNEAGKGWHVGRHNFRFNKVVPSGADGISGGTFQPYWDGTASSGAGAFVQFHPVPTGNPPGSELTNILPLAYGDNWYEGSANTGAVTPCALLMHALWARYPSGFKMLKFAQAQGFGGANGWGVNTPGSALAAAIAELTLMAAALTGGDTLDVKAIIIDCSSTDLANVNVTYVDDAQNFIDIARSAVDGVAAVTCATTTPIVIVNHHADMLPIGTTASAIRLMRRLNASLVQDNDDVHLFDMGWATDWQSFGVTTLPPGGPPPFALGVNLPGVENPNKLYYSPETYLQAGARLGSFLMGVLAGAPPIPQGYAMPVVVMIGDSQFVGTIDTTNILTTEQASLLGPLGGTDRDYQYVWNNNGGVVQAYDVMANSNTFGTVTTTYFGPDATFLKAMGAEFPNGVALFKYARNGVSLTLEANGTANAVEKDAATIWNDIRAAWMLFKAKVLETYGVSPDCVGIVTDLGSNDEGTASAYNAFATKAGEFVDDIRELFSTRATGGALPVVWLQPPPHIYAGGNSGHNIPEGATSVRATIAALPSQKENLAVVLNTGADKYELKRSESPPVHYGGEANFQIGYDLADALIPLIGAAAGSPGAGAGGDVDAGIDIPSETATFVVETGTGSATANSYCATATATTYHETYGNPDQWIAASPFAQEDALRQATRALDIRYGSWWSGVRYGSTQALDWPRAYVYDQAGNPVPATTIPTRLQQATAILALLHVQGENILPSTSTTADIRSETLSSASGASKSVTYIGGKRAETQFPIIDRMLASAGLTSGGAGWGWLDL
jgi:hypothetical protein